jgi:hypothetical protein
MQRNRSQRRNNNDVNNNQVNRRDRDYFGHRNILDLFKDDFSDPFDDDLFSGFGFGGSRRRGNEISLFGGGSAGFDSIFNHFKGMDKDVFSG